MAGEVFGTLYSGCSGNATYLGDRSGGILIDVGKNAKQTTLALQEMGLVPESIHAIFLTHEHSDHIAGLRVFANRYHIPVYGSLGTLEALDSKGHLRGDFPVFQMVSTADIGDFHVACFHTSHDCAEGMGYTVTLPSGKNVSVATDLGVMTEEVKSSILGSRTVLLESNHDLGMLFNGPYPYALKQRISSETGHLNNDDAADTAMDLVRAGTQHIILGHLSRENNLPDLAYQTTASMLLGGGAKAGADYLLDVAPRSRTLLTEVL
ncbi:MAG: MBL fold metallo-hydrolase [Clostridia bacterium]|nr:MBL fold metallo-hydrolase [Clostridia bacterium]